MKSKNTINALIESLQLYLADNSFTYERYRQDPGRVEGRGDIRGKGRISIFEQNERAIIRVDAYKANFGEVNFGIDINVRRAYFNGDASQGELPLLDVRDRIFDWSQQLDTGATTNNDILALGYTGSTGITRNDNFVTLTMNFTGRRDFCANLT